MHKEWVEAKLADICAPHGLQTGPFGSQLKAEEYVDDVDGVPVAMPKDLIDGRINSATIARVSRKKAREMARHELRKGDLVFARRGELGRIAIVTQAEDGWICGTGCLRARLLSAVDPEFVALFFTTASSVQWLNDNAVGQTMLNLNTEILAALPIKFPPIGEQRGVARILRTWDCAIETAERLINAKAAVFEHWSHALLTGRRQLGRKRINWQSVPLTDATLEVSARNEDRQLAANSVMAVNKVHGMIPMKDHVRAADLSRYKVVHPKAFAYNPMRLNIGSIAQNNHGRDVLVSPDYVAFEARADLLMPAYFDHVRRAPMWSRFVKTAGSGGVRIRIYYEDLSGFILELPSLEEQARIVEVLDTARREMAILERQRDALVLQKRGLMQKLLTGEWSVSISGSCEAAE
ncbi:restriction endonuclease subunit S [Bradyrhizobium ontarionense]|uniref:Restriction endonuclease subunit S n=1 Tax=Bradyrhizobium ontarionense TaxID=2898149 RepID=A0ABY3R5K2_9BRAD|nr:restriction endonuclease subunit S [Bradyrhizobium sp. A19]UFZ02601.1 restriction endonuclease subunit S [Bradyrhizobium sp. A19]